MQIQLKTATPFPDQDRIQNDVAWAKYQSKLDMSEVYEQICVIERDVPKTGFATIQGTFLSNVIQQGDCNAPSTFQRLMSHLYSATILADLFIAILMTYSSTLTPSKIIRGTWQLYFESLEKITYYFPKRKRRLTYILQIWIA